MPRATTAAVATAALVVALAAAAGPAAPEEAESRAEALAALRRARAETVKPARPSRVIEVLTRLENDGVDPYVTLQAGDLRMGFGQLSPLSSLAPALRFERPRIGQSELSLWISASVSWRGYQDYGLQMGRFDRPELPAARASAAFGAPFDFDRRVQRPNQRYIYAEARHLNLPEERFFGLGTGSREADHTTFRLETTDFAVVGGWQPLRGIAIAGRAGLLLTNVGPGTYEDHPTSDRLFAAAAIPGLDRQPDFVHLETRLLLAREDDPERPAGNLGLTVERFDDHGGNRFRFTRYAVDARGFLPLGSRQRVIAARLWLSHADPDRGSAVPFYLMSTIGGPERLRGYRHDRFRERKLVYVSGEYRWEANPAVELALFYDAGKAFADDSRFDFDGLMRGWGGGIRFKALRHTVLRLDIGHSDEGTFAYFRFGPSF